MLASNPVWKFLLWFTLLYILSLLMWRGLEAPYSEKFRAFGKFFFSDFRSKGTVMFAPLDNPEDKRFSTSLMLMNKNSYEAAVKKAKTSGQRAAPLRSVNVTVSSWYTGFLPTILVVTLILATPFIGIKRKLVALLWGLLLIHAFIWFQLYIQILYEFNRVEFLQVVSFSPFWQKVMDSLYYLFVESMGLRFIIPVFIWIFVTFQKGDLEKLRT